MFKASALQQFHLMSDVVEAENERMNDEQTSIVQPSLGLGYVTYYSCVCFNPMPALVVCLQLITYTVLVP